MTEVFESMTEVTVELQLSQGKILEITTPFNGQHGSDRLPYYSMCTILVPCVCGCVSVWVCLCLYDIKLEVCPF